MSSHLHIPTPPSILDTVRLRNIQLPLPVGPDAWHRPSKPQPCTASLKLTYASAVAAAEKDDVSLSIDYGKLYRRLESGLKAFNGQGQNDDDIRGIAGVVAGVGLGLLEETAAGVRRMGHTHTHTHGAGQATGPIAIDDVYGRCEVQLGLPKAVLRADGGLHYRSSTVWGYKSNNTADESARSERYPVVVEEEFRIEGIKAYCILGVNSHERVEKQAVVTRLEFSGPGGKLAWAEQVVQTYQRMVREVAERVEATSFQTVESLATFIARIATVEFGNERVTVRVEKPSALAFVEGSGVEVTRSLKFFRERGEA
ncbi:Dihydroneopterin aldolase-domain-containing protein [Aspergillus venezuelensis]